MLKFPYGIANFHALITQGYVYIDRTDRIRLLEDTGPTLILLRPRRFGKSLLLSTLDNYYDIKRANEFEQLFGHLAIGQNPTPNHNQYFILKWDFSAMMMHGDEYALKQALYDNINASIANFKAYYQDILTEEIVIYDQNALRSFHSLNSAVGLSAHKLYLLIDEYDNFANEVLTSASDPKRYMALVEGEGMLKSLFKVVKSALGGGSLERVFITGVSPVAMSDLTSSFNVAENIYLMPEFNDLCGWREDEVAALLQQVGQECSFNPLQIQNALDTMRTFYNGYSFTYNEKPLIYNPTLTLYFLKKFQESCQYPREMLDHNLAMDRQKLIYISQLVNGKVVLANALNEEQPLIANKLADRFGVREILHYSEDVRSIVSLLYYFGVLTLTENYTDFGELIFKIPNLVIKQLYVERIQELLLPTGTEQDQVQQVARQFYGQGDMGAVCDFIEQKYFPLFDNRDYRWTNELNIKTLFMTVLFNDIFYIMDSETALQRGYGDLTMLVRPNMRRFKLLDFLLEFKYIPLKEIGLSGAEVRALSAEAVRELPLVKANLAAAVNQTPAYRQTLEGVYGDKLHLRCYGVVSVGYDRLVWQEILP